MTDIYRVTAPYVNLKSKDAATGKDVILGYYAGALVPESVDAEDLARHIRKGMVEKLDGAEARAVAKANAEAEKTAVEPAADPEAAKVIKQAEVDRAAAEKAAADEDAEAAKAGKPVIKASDGKPGAKTAQAG